MNENIIIENTLYEGDNMIQFKLDKKSVNKIIKEVLQQTRPELENIRTRFHTEDNSNEPFSSGVLTTVTVTATIKLADIPTKYREELYIKDIKEYIIKYFSEKKPDLKIAEVVFDDGMDYESVGYFMEEHDEEKPYCKGVTITAFEKEKDKDKILDSYSKGESR